MLTKKEPEEVIKVRTLSNAILTKFAKEDSGMMVIAMVETAIKLIKVQNPDMSTIQAYERYMQLIFVMAESERTGKVIGHPSIKA